MSRPLRIEFEGAWYHVMNRGANHQAIFYNDSNRLTFLKLLEDISLKFQAEIHAFCLMSNHYHILMRTIRANLQKIMRHLDGVYTLRFNRAEERDGPLFRGRYKSILIDSDEYLLQVWRYIHLNPIEANICKNLNEYHWSSYSAYVECKKILSSLETVFISEMFGHSQESLLNFLGKGIDLEIKEIYTKKKLPAILGNEDFILSSLKKASCSQKCDSSSDINFLISKRNNIVGIDLLLNVIQNYFNIDWNSIKFSKKGKTNLPRNIAMYLCKIICHLSHKEIADYFFIPCASVSTALNRFEKQIISDESINFHLNKIKSYVLVNVG